MATVVSPDTEADVVLRDGSMVHVRPASPADEPSIRAFLGRLSPESLHLRFGTAATNLDAAARQRAGAASREHLSMLAMTGVDHVVVGEAGYERVSDDRAEIAIVVADQYHGHGLGTNLLGLLAGIADAGGIRIFEAEVLPENGPMLEVFRESGLPVRIRSEPGVVRVEISTSMTPDARGRFEHREELAAAAAVRALLCPRSIAVIGASRNRQTIGGRLFRNLIDGEFTGPVYPVNPAARSVQGVRAYASILEIPDSVDIALVVVPADAVATVARECARHGVKGLVVISAGFSEIGAVGAERQAELLAICREAGMRLVGPNCMGVSNTAADVQMNGQFRAHCAIARERRVPLPERCPRPGSHRPCEPTWVGSVDVRVGRQQGRPVGQRLPLLLGRRCGHGRHPPVSRVAGKSKALRADRPTGSSHQADRGRQERPIGCRRPGNLLPHGRSPRSIRRHGRRSVQAGGCRPHRHARRTV